MICAAPLTRYYGSWESLNSILEFERFCCSTGFGELCIATNIVWAVLVAGGWWCAINIRPDDKALPLHPSSLTMLRCECLWQVSKPCQRYASTSWWEGLRELSITRHAGLLPFFWSWIVQCQAEPAHLEQAWYAMIVFFGIQGAHSLDVHAGEAGEAATFGECPTIVQANSDWNSSEMWWDWFFVMGCLVDWTCGWTADTSESVSESVQEPQTASQWRCQIRAARKAKSMAAGCFLSSKHRFSCVRPKLIQMLLMIGFWWRLQISKGSWGFQTKRREGESRSPVEGFDFYRFSQSTLNIFSRSTNDFRTLSQKLNIFHIIQIVS